MNNFEEKPNEIKILFFESLGSVPNHIYFIFLKKEMFLCFMNYEGKNIKI